MNLQYKNMYYVGCPSSAIYKTPGPVNETYFESPLCDGFCPAQQKAFDDLEKNIMNSPVKTDIKGQGAVDWKGDNVYQLNPMYNTYQHSLEMYDQCCGGYFG